MSFLAATTDSLLDSLGCGAFQYGELDLLVGGLEHFCFSKYWECHHPNWL